LLRLSLLKPHVQRATGIRKQHERMWRTPWRCLTDYRPSDPAAAQVCCPTGRRALCEAAYRRGDLFEKRRQLMVAWAGFCDAPVGRKVVPIAGVRELVDGGG